MIAQYYQKAVELGLIKEKTAVEDPEERYAILKQLSEEDIEKRRLESEALSEAIKLRSSEIDRERFLKDEIHNITERLSIIKSFDKPFDDYGGALSKEIERLNVSSWLRNRLPDSSDNPTSLFAKQELDDLANALEAAEKEVDKVEFLSKNLDKEKLSLERQLSEYTEELNSISKAKAATKDIGRMKGDGDVQRFLGCLQVAIQTQLNPAVFPELDAKIAEVGQTIAELTKKAGEDPKASLLASLKTIGVEMRTTLDKLDSDTPSGVVFFDPDELSLAFGEKSEDRKYLWDLGSASNWLSCHIATILGFQSAFLRRIDNPVPSFAVFDQPSQVYFPHNWTKSDFSSGGTDEKAVKQVFDVLSRFVKDHPSFQIIVTEHAGKEIWGEMECVYEAADWSGEEDKLVPPQWTR